MRAYPILVALAVVGLLIGCAETPPRREPAPVVSGTAVRDQPTLNQPDAGMRRNPESGDTNSRAPRYPSPQPIPRTENRRIQPLGDLPAIRAPAASEPPAMRAPVASESPAIHYEPRATPAPVETRPVTSTTPQLMPGAFDPPQPTGPETEGIGIGTRTVSDDPSTTLRRYESTAPSAPSPAHSRAATTLLAIAEREETQGKFGDAALQVDRAIDLEPRNADLWHHLARLRLAEGRLEAAIEAADTSNKLAGGNLELRRNNWRLISEVRFEQGDTAAAEQAARMVEELY